MRMGATDILVIGGGVIGLNMALLAKRRYPDCEVTLIEKERDCGLHASGRNSGVLHAGFYYTADSLKARFSRDGNRLLTEYCIERGLGINRCGKLVVVRSAGELEVLDELLRRGRTNGVDLQELSEKEAVEIQPGVKTYQRAIFSPTTSTVDPVEVIKSLMQDVRREGVTVLADTAYLRHDGNDVYTAQGKLSAGYVINAAGLYADKIARDYGFAQNYAIIPFKGLYLKSGEPAGAIRTHIYPVPNLENPFLGVHFTVSVSGKAKVGPTAIPAFWREHYKGFANFDMAEMVEIVVRELGLLVRNDFGFRSLAIEELSKYARPKMVRLANQLVSGVSAKHYREWGAPGIRAQLFNTKERKLEMDFHFEGDDRSFHVLNAVSPAFTCSIPFTRFLFDEIDMLMRRENSGPSE